MLARKHYSQHTTATANRKSSKQQQQQQQPATAKCVHMVCVSCNGSEHVVTHYCCTLAKIKRLCAGSGRTRDYQNRGNAVAADKVKIRDGSTLKGVKCGNPPVEADLRCGFPETSPPLANMSAVRRVRPPPPQCRLCLRLCLVPPCAQNGAHTEAPADLSAALQRPSWRPTPTHRADVCGGVAAAVVAQCGSDTDRHTTQLLTPRRQ